MSWENESSLKMHINFTSKIFCPVGVYPDSEIIEFASFKKPKNIIEKFIYWIKLKYEYYNWLSEQQNKFDIILLRYSVHDPFLLKFLKEAKIPIYLVHHTLELPELRSFNTVGKIRGFLEEKIGGKCIDESYGIICVTNEIKKFEISRLSKANVNKPTYIYPNGILLKNNTSLSDKREDIPELLFVASYFFDWHGLDLILKDIINNNDDFILHIIGRVDDWQKDIIKVDSRVRFHGLKSTKEIQEIAERCWVGLSSFSLDRKGMTEACTLKVREYLSMGLPVYAGHKDVFLEDFSYYMFGSPKIDFILAYAKKMRNINRIEIRSEANELINKEILLLNLYSYLGKKD
nr:glycosyltransferase family 1 protein [Acinetobacter sp. YH12251]